MRINIIIIVLLGLSSFSSVAQRYHYFSSSKGAVTKWDGQKFELQNLTLMSWRHSFGRVTDLYGETKLKCEDIEISISEVKSISFEKVEDPQPEYILFFANVMLKNGNTGRFLVSRVLNNGYNNPYYSFVGKNDFGTVEIKIWDVKSITFDY